MNNENHPLNQLPSYAGIKGVTQVGMSVDQCAGLMARLAAVKSRTTQIAAARMTGTPEWELKAALARWMWEDATTYRDLEQRVKELRSNRPAIAKVLDYPLGDFLTEILHSPDSLELVVGLFDVLAPAYCAAVRTYLERTQPLVDQPSIRLLKGVLAEEEERLALGHQFVDVLSRVPGGEQRRAEWKRHCEQFLTAAGGVLGDQLVPTDFRRPQPRAKEEYRISREMRRDERFATTIPKTNPFDHAKDPVRATIWVRVQEMTAAELCAAVLFEWDHLPTDAIVDLSRQCWDEVRHSLFGCAAFEHEGHNPWDFVSWVGYAGHTLHVPPQKGWAHLTLATEAKLMAYPGGKRGEWEFMRNEAQHPLMTTFQDFDWADEVLHVGFGRKWLIEHYFKGDRVKARQIADETIREREEFYAKYSAADQSEGY